MPVVTATFAVVALVWGAIVARRSSLLVGCGLSLVVAYALGHEFWNLHAGPLPITLDRLLLAAIVVLFVVEWRLGKISLRQLTGADCVLIVLLGIVTLSALLSGQPDIADGVTSKWGRLLASFLLPTVLYIIVRQLAITERDWSRVLVALVCLGVYLAVTGVCEVAGVWSLVFPRYIADPELGIHFGRARGPELNSVSLGLYITACCVCAAALYPQAKQRWQQLALICALPVMTFGLLLTYTRSTWIGFAVSGLIVAAFYIPPRLRVPAVVCGALGGLLLVAVSWSHLIGLEREGTAEEAHHSVDQRASFAYVSWQMFRDHPIFGVGFGRFYDEKLPYLSDRRQKVELDSIRSLHHHNTLLSFLTETGMIGLAAFVALLVAWGRTAWQLATSAAAPPWVRMHGVVLLALLVNYLSSAVFHDLTLLPSQELLLFLFAGVAVNVRQCMLAAAVAPGALEGAAYRTGTSRLSIA
ncbi:MAG: O-antigen ligase family protein [Pirellulales bacterium]